MVNEVIQMCLWGVDMGFNPQNGDICILTSKEKEKQISDGLASIPCFVEVEYQNEYCWLIRYKDSEQCNIIKKSDDRYFFKIID